MLPKKSPPKDLRQLLDLDQDPRQRPHLYAVGLQEVAVDASSILPEGFYEDKWSDKITGVMANYGYVRLESARTMGILLLVYVRREALTCYSHVEAQVTRTGIGNVLGNKGGVSIRMDINGTNVIFLNCHFAAHVERVMDRIEDYIRILEKQQFEDSSVDNILDHDYVFWFGDVNFRLDDLSNEEAKRLIAEKKYKQLLQHDQLNKARENELAFVGFEEGEISFAPTFKFDKDSDVYDSSPKQRKPGWTDRILWMCNTDAYEDVELRVQQQQYTSLDSLRLSDHRPVISRNTILVQVESLPQVTFDPISRLRVGTDAEISYRVSKNVSTSSWDWVALYRADFCHIKDYLTYFWAAPVVRMRGSSTCLVLPLDGSYLGLPPGHYYLGYYSSKRSALLGLSDMFELYLTPGQKFSLSESSYSSSSEDSELDSSASLPGLTALPPTSTKLPSSSSDPESSDSSPPSSLGPAPPPEDGEFMGIFNPSFGMQPNSSSSRSGFAPGFDGAGFANPGFGAPRGARHRRAQAEGADELREQRV